MKFKTYCILHSHLWIKTKSHLTIVYQFKYDNTNISFIGCNLRNQWFTFYEKPRSNEVRFLLSHMQGPLWRVSTFVARIWHMYTKWWKITVCKWSRKVKQNSLHRSVFALLDIFAFHMFFEHLMRCSGIQRPFDRYYKKFKFDVSRFHKVFKLNTYKWSYTNENRISSVKSSDFEKNKWFLSYTWKCTKKGKSSYFQETICFQNF